MNPRSKIIFSLSLLFAFLFISSSTELFAQGKIVGHIKDAKTGEPLIGVNVIIQDTYLGAATDLNGDYVIVNVPVGQYSVKASMVGATTVVKTDVVVSTGQITQVDFQLEQTAIQGKEVVVTAQRDILHKDVSSSQIVVNNQQINDAAGVRTLQDFLNTQAGITDNSYLEIRGGTPGETGTMINGLTFVNARVGEAQSFVPTSAIEQVSLKAGGMDAEYGQFRSGLIGVTTKTGTMDGYHGSFSFSQSPAHMKRFGPSLFDPMNNYLRPHLDPTIAFIGVSAAEQQGIITPYEAQQFGQYPTFLGWDNLTGRNIPSSWTQSLKPGQEITPVDLYLFDAWMHMVNPDFAKLNATINKLNAQGLNVGSPVTDQNLMNLYKNHANSEDKYGDFNFDGGFGGPIPFLSKTLGDATFYLSNVTNRTSYVEPMELDYDLKSTTMLVMKANVTKAITLKVTGLYGYEKGMNPARGADSEPATLSGSDANDLSPSGIGTIYEGLDRGALMPENNIPLFTSSGSNYGPTYYWYNTMLQPWIQKNLLTGFELTHAISSSTFYEITGSYQRTRDDINPDNSTMRNNTVLGYAGPLPLTEMPYGRNILPLGQSTDTIAGFVYDQYFSIPGLSERFDSKGAVYYDNSLTQQARLKFDFGSQITKQHFIKAGLEYNYTGLNNNRWSYWPNQGPLSMYEYNFNVYPRNLGAYAEDQVTFEDMIANIGVRADYYSFGDLTWPTGDPWNADAFAPPNWTPSNYLDILQSGGSVIWDHWNAINAEDIAQGKTPLLQPVATHLVFSPRFGISFPISTKAKFYFNYGQFRSMPPLEDMLAYDFRYDTQKGGIYELGNPNLAPAKTIQYELGVDYNLLDQYLIHIAGYSKDVTGDVRAITLDPNSGTGIRSYRYRTNDRYSSIQGLEIQISKTVGKYITGWLNLQYTYESSGETGKTDIYQDPATNVTTGFYYANPSRPYPVPEIKANINFRTPDDWGYLVGGWNLSVLPDWREGDRFTYNPRGTDEGAQNYFYWPNIWIVNLKLSKSFNVGFLTATAYVNVNNLFNFKQFLYNDAFYGGDGSASGTDYESYMASLHLNAYQGSYYDAIRNEATGSYLYPGYVYQQDETDPISGITHKKGSTVGSEDQVGDMHSASKPWINSPDADLFTYGMTRSVWMGIKFDF
jgi:outer membrane receptor protein involved in Fe transport